jgi:hypothetical protein
MHAGCHSIIHGAAPLVVLCVEASAEQQLALSWVAARAPGEVPRSAPLPVELRAVYSVA